MNDKFMSLAATLGLLALAGFARAEEARETGFKSSLELTTEGVANLSGGIRSGLLLHGMALGRIEYDRPGCKFYASVLDLAGRGPSERLVGDLQTASNIEGCASLRLYSWWLEKSFGPWQVRAGVLLADEEFTGNESGGNLLNSSFGWPVFISANTLNTGPLIHPPPEKARSSLA